MECRFANCTLSAADKCVMCEEIAHINCSKQYLCSAGVNNSELALCSKQCCDAFILEEFLLDINWDSTNASLSSQPRERTSIIAKRIQRHYNIQKRQRVLQLFNQNPLQSQRKFAQLQNIPEATLRRWLKKQDQYLCISPGSRKNVDSIQRDIAIPFGLDLVVFMKDVRREERILTTALMISWIKLNHQQWLDAYLNDKKNEVSGYNTLLRLLQRFSHRHGFVQRVPCISKMLQQELFKIRDDFANSFWSKYGHVPKSCLINVDETAVYYDMPPRYTWAERGESSKVDKSQKHSDRLTAVLTIGADGRKYPILFIVNGKPGGPIEQQELKSYPKEHCYIVQPDAWMDDRVWKYYLLHLLKPSLQNLGSCVILADNLKCHVSNESSTIIENDLSSILQPLPPNSTSVCQPLDVGVMGPLKSNLRSLWLKEERVATASEKRRMMIRRVITAWENFKTTTIVSSFEKALPQSSN